MNFIGSIPRETIRIFHTLLSGYRRKDVYVGCSGNYTIDRLCANMGFRVHSNDVSLYSKCIADILLRQDTVFLCKSPLLSEVYERWEESEYKKFIEVLFALNLAQFEKKKNYYQCFMFEEMIKGADQFYKSNRERLKNLLDFKIAEFGFCDFIEHLKRKDRGVCGLIFPPTYKGGYEKMFSFVEETFDYERANYKIFDPSEAEDVFFGLLRDGMNIIVSDRNLERLEGFKIAEIDKAKKRNLFVYASEDWGVKKKFFVREQLKPVVSKIKVLPYSYEFSENSKIGFFEVKKSDILYFKELYMSNRVNFSDGGDLSLCFTCDGMAFGFVSISKRLENFKEGLIFLHSDFVCRSKIERLSKLLLMCIVSKDVKKYISRKLIHSYNGLYTSVYTDKAVSMKYRGVFKLSHREEGKLVYIGEFIESSIVEQVDKFWRKYGKSGSCE